VLLDGQVQFFIGSCLGGKAARALDPQPAFAAQIVPKNKNTQPKWMYQLMTYQ
jgi:hypothetical protein